MGYVVSLIFKNKIGAGRIQEILNFGLFCEREIQNFVLFGT